MMHSSIFVAHPSTSSTYLSLPQLPFLALPDCVYRHLSSDPSPVFCYAPASSPSPSQSLSSSPAHSPSLSLFHTPCHSLLSISFLTSFPCFSTLRISTSKIFSKQQRQVWFTDFLALVYCRNKTRRGTAHDS